MSAREKPLLGVILFAGVFLYLGWEVIRQETGALSGGGASASWPTVEGRIVSSMVQTKRATGGSQPRYYPEVEFEYTVGNESFLGDRVSFDTQPMNHAAAAGIAKRYAVGRDVTVFYNPEDASESVLEPGTSEGSWLGIGLGIVFAIVAGAMLITRLRKRPAA